MTVTRFAPSPTGYLHIGHAYSAWFARNCAQRADGRFLLRIEDIDATRCKPEFETAIRADLRWLGLDWDGAVRRQSEHMADYAGALERLEAQDITYPCFCTRKEILAEIAAMGGAPHGPEGPLYPGTCRQLSAAERTARIAAGEPYAIRLDIAAALDRTGPLVWRDLDTGEHAVDPTITGDAVLARKDIATSYHLAVTHDDHVQGVTLVTRGEDLAFASGLHRLLQELLGYDVPVWRHHRLLTDENGDRFAKRDAGVTLRDLRESGHSPAEVRVMAGIPD
jgi:glutamyl-Q tRNA(Asp) synthetase